MDFIKVSAKTVDEAITKALIQLETTSDKIEYEVLDKGSTGILGMFGVKPAVIQARRKPGADDFEDLMPEAPAAKETYAAPVEKTVPEVIYEGDCIFEKSAVQFFSQVFAAMEQEVKVTAKYDEAAKELAVELEGAEMGTLIGKRGQTLDSLQYLVSIVVNKNSDDYIRVKVDTENYRQRRKETLESLAKNLAYKVKRTKRPVSLEPMNPYERRIIHSALQHDRYVVTRSEGEEPFRHVVIALKREDIAIVKPGEQVGAVSLYEAAPTF